MNLSRLDCRHHRRRACWSVAIGWPPGPAELAADMDFSVLYNQQRHLFAIGYNLTLGRLDNAHYDLLASEAALTSFLAVARGEAPRRHWFQLGRPLTRVVRPGRPAVLGRHHVRVPDARTCSCTPCPTRCWPKASMPPWSARSNTAKQRRVPWGVSESGYSTLDSGLDYQYQSFGVPGLGLRRGLGQDLVVAPYATLLALQVRPHAAVRQSAPADRGTCRGAVWLL